MLQRPMIKLVIAMSMFAFAGCKKKSGADDSMAKMEAFAKQMCECKDKACADQVQADMTKWSTSSMSSAKPDPEMAKKSQQAMSRYTECMTKAAGMAGDMQGGDMKGGDMKGGDMRGGDMKGSDMK
jgi:hypothetical protein